jgi:hypothetical protein
VVRAVDCVVIVGTVDDIVLPDAFPKSNSLVVGDLVYTLDKKSKLPTLDAIVCVRSCAFSLLICV